MSAKKGSALATPQCRTHSGAHSTTPVSMVTSEWPSSGHHQPDSLSMLRIIIIGMQGRRVYLDVLSLVPELICTPFLHKPDAFISAMASFPRPTRKRLMKSSACKCARYTFSPGHLGDALKNKCRGSRSNDKRSITSPSALRPRPNACAQTIPAP